MDDDMYLTGVSWAVGYFVPTLLWWFDGGGGGCGGGIEREYHPLNVFIHFNSLHFQRKNKFRRSGSSSVWYRCLVLT